MPKKAFFNLAESKRQDMITKTMQLYADHAYEEVTLKRILEILSLNPASFYRYFEDKDELYLYATQVLYEKVDQHLRENYEDFDYEIFTFYENISVLSDLERAFSKTYMKAPRDVMLRGYMEIYKGWLSAKYKRGLRHLRYEGLLRPDTDDDLIAFMYATTMFNMILYFREAGIEDEAFQSKIKEYFYMSFFKYGILKRDEDETP